jgi:hypothetical protein
MQMPSIGVSDITIVNIPAVDIAHLPQQCHNCRYRSFATTMSQLKICDFSGETFKRFEVL